jgi:probable phosphoglycerate mutase
VTTILLIRHGQNEFVGKSKLAGWLPGVHLNEVGRKQAASLAQELARYKLEAIYSSPLERTMETAQPIAVGRGLQIFAREGLGEIDYGLWQGRTLKSLRKLKSWAIVQTRPSLARFPEGESFPEAQARVVAELEDLRQKHRSRKSIIACVSHGDIIKLAVAHYIGLPLDLFQRLVVEPASITSLSVGKEHVRLLALNDGRAGQIRGGG